MIPCPVCARTKGNGAKVCAYHRATTPAELLAAVYADLKSKGPTGFVRYLLAAQSKLVALDEELLDVLAAGTEDLEAKFLAILQKKTWTRDDLQLIAAYSLALAAITDDDAAEIKEAIG